MDFGVNYIIIYKCYNLIDSILKMGLSHQKQPYPMAGIHALHGIAAIFLRTSVGPMA